MTEEEKQLLKDLYDGKYFYEIGPQGEIRGPYTNIFYKHDMTGFVHVIDNTPIQEFTKDQIMVTDKLLLPIHKPRLKLDIPKGCALPQSYCSDCSCGKREMLENK